ICRVALKDFRRPTIDEDLKCNLARDLLAQRVRVDNRQTSHVGMRQPLRPLGVHRARTIKRDEVPPENRIGWPLAPRYVDVWAAHELVVHIRIAYQQDPRRRSVAPDSSPNRDHAKRPEDDEGK